MNLVPKKQLLLNVPFQSTKDRKKDLCVDNKVRETNGDVYFSTCRNEKCVIPFKDQKPTFMLFGGDGTRCFAKKTNRDHEKKHLLL